MIRLRDLTPYLCAADATTREVVERLNKASPYLFQVVVSPDGKLLGTVTDGDIRRAMLKGVALDAPATECMHRAPNTGRVGQDVENRHKLAATGGYRPFLPVLDDAGVLREILVQGDVAGGPARAVVMAGGPGTRLGEKTRNTPKPLLLLGEQPILGHVLDALEDAGVRQIDITIHYLAEQIETFVAKRANKAVIRLVRENMRLGTAGALSKLDPAPETPVLVVNGDVVSKADFGALAEFHEKHGLDGTIAAARHRVEVPFGVIRYGENGEFEGIEEKPRLDYFVAGGIYYLSPEFLRLVPQDQPMDMPELLNLGRKAGLQVGLFPLHEYWIDVGRPDDLSLAIRDHGNRLKSS